MKKTTHEIKMELANSEIDLIMQGINTVIEVYKEDSFYRNTAVKLLDKFNNYVVPHIEDGKDTTNLYLFQSEVKSLVFCFIGYINFMEQIKKDNEERSEIITKYENLCKNFLKE